ncbi:phospho-sugar mutase [Microbacterium sp. A1-JK]|uniref:phospho-sugar mutase n=1 Tax=Microbacterium sp. A1-JK TaxID=3177516 RepID=UPI003889BE45
MSADAASRTDDLLEAARAWLAQDPDGQTRDELRTLISGTEEADAAAAAELANRFSQRLAFGTAGLRGALGAGPNRMNRVLVAQAAAGLAAFLRERAGDGDAPSVVIGYDGRRNSDVFARDSAEIFAGAGLHAILLPRMLPTPVLAFAVRHLGASAGVMVTASHNPPDDNGYKVYLGGDDDGAQIVSPSDSSIAAHIQRIADTTELGDLPRSVGYSNADESLVEAYVTATAAVSPAPAGAHGLRWVYTAMHGVGWETLSRIVASAGYPAPIPVEAQLHPDGAFPTVAFPNPEEPGALDLAYETARENSADLIIANDPDADRLAVAIPDASAEGGWRMLSGNDVGLLLGWRAARAAVDENGVPRDPSATLACSLVSSPGLGRIAEHYGLGFRETLTGFKWISRAPGLVYGYEEALGYLVNPGTVRDKDGISAAIAMLGLIGQARKEGQTIADVLAEFRETFGAFASDQISIRVDDVAEIAAMMARLRDDLPRTVGGIAASQVDDLRDGLGDLPPGDVLRFALEDGSRLIVRPSGTEPKLKLYLDVRATTEKKARKRLAELAAGAREMLDAVR